jgi:two-component system, OmpR family, phosphate regulon sensor histidine kinase PhoR
VLKRKLLYVLTLPFILLIIITLFSFGYYSINIFEDFFINSAKDELKSKTLIIKKEFDDNFINQVDSAKISPLKNISDLLDKNSDTRITIIHPDGRVIYDTREEASRMDNHLDRPEIKDALKGDLGFSNRFSYTLHMNMLYTAILLFNKNNKMVGILRTGISVDKINNSLRSSTKEIIFAGMVILILASVIGIFVSRKIAKPLLEMKTFAEDFTRGKFDNKIYSPKVVELESLGDSLNSMASQLDEKIRIISEQKNIQQAVLEGMKEGVLAIDNDERILLINKTAEDILNIKNNNVKGKTIQEVARITDIQRFFKKIVLEKSYKETEITIKEENDKILQITGNVLVDSNNKNLGVLVVLNDITELKQLDNLKRDFVANISHELKTPITTIKGFIETLREGAIKDPKNAKRFLDIVSKHADRLNEIIEDLLSLSRLEQKSALEDIKFIEDKVKPIISTVIEDFQLRAKDKEISVKSECSDDITALINPPLIEEAIGNLLDNAIKYSQNGSNIFISVIEVNQWITISVIDEGPGISQEHLPRLFERFYRVDKARSRDVGGTGLGLAIVKHIAQVHKGITEVESELGKGSTFKIKIPAIEKQ